MAATWRCAFNEIVAEPLTKKNHEAWFEWVENYLRAQGLWEVIDYEKEDEVHDEELVRWRRKNAAALHMIQISCTPKSFSYIKGVSEAKDAWTILQKKYPKQEYSQRDIKMEDQIDFNVGDFYKAIRYDNWHDAKAIIDEHPSALSAKLNTTGHTALHVAAMYGCELIVEELVRSVHFLPEHLEILDEEGCTPLAITAQYGGELGDMIRVAECMVNKNRNILAIPTLKMYLPVTLAFSSGHKEMGRYLYSQTPLECLKPDKGVQGPIFLRFCFTAGDLDVALDLVEKCEELLFTEVVEVEDGWTPIKDIASMPHLFLGGTTLVFWKRLIFKFIYNGDVSIRHSNFVRIDIQQQGQSQRFRGVGLMQRVISHTHNLLGMKDVYEMKTLREQAAKILRLICRNLNVIDRNTKQEKLLTDALIDAAKEGNFEFVDNVTKANPSTVFLEKSDQHLFFYAIQYRQARVFHLIHSTGFKNELARQIDERSGNSMLHVAAMLAPASQLNRIPGPVLQMQRELQWFKEVESVVHPAIQKYRNLDGKKAEDLFKESHKELRKDGEQWMKDTATSCSVVGALVITIMFAAAFTVPGGNNQESGYPIFLQEELFLLFIISDALSLFASTISVLVFLGILTSRYAEEDFLLSLPKKLITGLSTLFFSIVTMMIAFSACILIMLQHRYRWPLLPVIIFLFASIPVTLFALFQFPLLVQMVSSTYRSGIAWS